MELISTPTPAKTGFNWGNFFSFKTLITLHIIQAVYVIVAILLTLGGLIMMFSIIGFLPGLLLLTAGNIFWRIWCELIIVFFRINKTLSNIDEKIK